MWTLLVRCPKLREDVNISSPILMLAVDGPRQYQANTQSVITGLNSIFSTNGFPRVLISDNGVQFTSKTFQRYCSTHDIKKIETEPYHTQSNGIVERMHGTLVPLIHKYCDGKKGRWPEMVQLALYFLRMTSDGSTGFSPYPIVHNWVPASPLEVLQQGWLEEELREMDMYQWVKENTEWVGAIRDKVTLSQV